MLTRFFILVEQIPRYDTQGLYCHLSWPIANGARDLYAYMEKQNNIANVCIHITFNH